MIKGWGIGLKMAVVAMSMWMSNACAMAEEGPISQDPAPHYGYSIKSSKDGKLVWRIKNSAGEVLDLAPEEKQRILREICFPRALKHAGEGKSPEVWSVGFFYLDGVATGKDLAKAEVALRRGLEIGHPDGLLLLAGIYHGMAVAEKREEYFRKAGDLYVEVLAAGFKVPAANMTSLAATYIRGSYGVKKDLVHAAALLETTQKIHPDDPHIQLSMAELRFHQKRYPECFEAAKTAEQGLLAEPEKLKRARSFKIAGAVLGGQVSKVDPKEFMELGLTGAAAWVILSILILALGFLLWWTRRAWRKEPGEGPGLRLTLCWISASVLGAGIGFSIRLPGLDNGAGRWIGAILISAFCLLAMMGGGWRRYFGSFPICSGPRGVFKGLAIITGCIAGMMLVLIGYQAIHQWVTGRSLDQQLVALFLKSENLWQLSGTILIAGIAIPFYEELIYRGFFYESLSRRWGVKTGLVVSSVVFALVHGLTYAPPLLFLAFALGWVRLKTGNLKMSFLIHAANNCLSVLLAYFVAS